MNEDLYLVVRIAGHTVALDARDVSSVVEVDRITPVPRVPRHIAGLFALRSRVLTVVDAQAALGYPSIDMTRLLTAVIVVVDGHSYALLVDDVADVVSAGAPEPCRGVLGAGWARVAVGQLAEQAGALLLIDPTRLVAGDAAAEAA